MKKNINKFEQLLGFKTNNIELYKNAITHKSVNKIVNYEKLLDIYSYLFPNNQDHKYLLLEFFY